MSYLEDQWQRTRRFFEEFAGGIKSRDVQQLFEEDATQAFRALSQERPPTGSSDDEFERFFLGVRDFFLGLALKLSPARRLLFTACLLMPLLGVFLVSDFDLNLASNHFQIDFSPFWFVLSIAGLTLLLALELVDRLRVRDELEVARQLQSDLLPDAAPSLAGFEFAHSYRPANEIGGDYYDFLTLDDGRVAIAVGDASGHGIGAGLLMAITNASLKTALDIDPSPPAVLSLLNRTLFRTGSRRAFMTLFYGVLDPTTGHLEYASAGHPFPILRRLNGQQIELGSGAFPLGLKEAAEYESRHVEIAEGDLLLLYSDGIPEAIAGDNDRDEAFGFGRLASLLETPESASTVHDRILRDLDRHLANQPLRDDLTLVVMRRTRTLPPPPPLPSPSLDGQTEVPQPPADC